MNSPRTLTRRLLPLFALLVAGSCSDGDPVFIDQIGTVKIQPTSPSLGQQTIKDSDLSMQAAVWNIRVATLTVDGLTIDLLTGNKCLYANTAVVPPTSEQNCGNGIVVDSLDEVVEARVDIAFTMKFSRAQPVELPLGGDFDGDGFLNEVDVCPLVVNPRQSLDPCSIIASTGIFLSDSDADLIIDPQDNCVWISNSSQNNTTGLAAVDINDFIGDACNEERADVELDGSREIVLEGVMIDYVQPLDRLSYIVLEIDHKDGVNCDFRSGICTLDEDAIKVCQQFDELSARVGCP